MFSTYIYFFLVLLSYHFTYIRALHFYLPVSTPKCFEHTVTSPSRPIIISYQIEENAGLDCKIVIQNSYGIEVDKYQIKDNIPKGRYAYKASDSDDYKVCVSCHGAFWFDPSYVKWTISFDIGDSDLDLDESVKKSHINEINDILSEISSSLESIYIENDYQRKKEEQFKKSLKKINKRIVWVTVIQIFTAAGVSLFLTYHLTRFFRAQKLV